MHKLSGSCHMCGMCCRAIVLSFSHDELKERPSVQDYLAGKVTRTDLWNDDPIFCYLNWKPISRDEAMEINPHLLNWEKLRLEDEKETGKSAPMNFYTCTKFDSETNRCTVHNERPRVCSAYPWYRGIDLNEMFYSLDCGYKIDIIQEEKLRSLDKETEQKEKFSDECELLGVEEDETPTFVAAKV